MYLLNAVLFVLVGLQLHPILNELLPDPATVRIGHAALISAVVIAVRVGWGFTVPYLIRTLDRRPAQRASPRERLVAGWSGMRGAVSLAAALALPLTTSTGQPFPHRHLIIFMTFAVILATLVVQGLTLPWLIRRLGLHRDDSETQEELWGRLRATDVALARLEELAAEDWTRGGSLDDDGTEDRSLADQRLVRELLEAQHREIVLLRNQGEISNQVMGRIEHDLDLEDARLEIQETPAYSAMVSHPRVLALSGKTASCWTRLSRP